MKKPLAASDWAILWKLRRAGFSLDLLPHSASGLELEVYPGNDPVRFALTENFTWLQVSVAMRARSLVSIVAASLFIDSPTREYHSASHARLPKEVQRRLCRSRTKTLQFAVGEGSVLHMPPRLHLAGCLLFGGEHDLPLLLPGQALPAELWLRDREGRYYGVGFAWRGGIALSAGRGEVVCRGEKPVPPPASIS